MKKKALKLLLLICLLSGCSNESDIPDGGWVCPTYEFTSFEKYICAYKKYINCNESRFLVHTDTNLNCKYEFTPGAAMASDLYEHDPFEHIYLKGTPSLCSIINFDDRLSLSARCYDLENVKAEDFRIDYDAADMKIDVIVGEEIAICYLIQTNYEIEYVKEKTHELLYRNILEGLKYVY